jgi:hypothetical protein
MRGSYAALVDSIIPGIETTRRLTWLSRACLTTNGVLSPIEKQTLRTAMYISVVRFRN